MLAAELKSTIKKIWNLFWSGGIANPLTAIEQISYLIFIKRLDDMDQKRRQDAEWADEPYTSMFEVDGKNYDDCRWSQFQNREAGDMLEHVRDRVFPFIKRLGTNSETGVAETKFSEMMKDAVFIIPKPSLLAEAVEHINELKITDQNLDTQGDIYEHLLDELKTSGKNGQFRTPRQIIRTMCELVNPKLGNRICDPACGTGGFLIGAYQHLLRANTSPNLIKMEEDGTEHGLVGDKITDSKVWSMIKNETFYGHDFDTTMLRIACMNMMLHGLDNPQISYTDALSKNYTVEEQYDVILANPPFKGSIDKGDIHDALRRDASTTKTELLFVLLIEGLLVTGGQAALIVPDGVLFGSSNAHKSVRKKLIDENQLDGVISLPPGVFKPYAGVSTAILVFSKGGTTKKVFYYDVKGDGYSLDDKRDPRPDENDLPDLIKKWKERRKLKGPKKGENWFWVTKKEIEENDHDLSLNRYKPIEYEETKYDPPGKIIDRLLDTERDIQKDLEELKGMLG
ncbi:MAG: DNA methyltransferase [Flavobacteriaceae bacterium]|nr:MAG: DNA methyltransferase [Flavobacteriaceae bacterium]